MLRDGVYQGEWRPSVVGLNNEGENEKWCIVYQSVKETQQCQLYHWTTIHVVRLLHVVFLVGGRINIQG